TYDWNFGDGQSSTAQNPTHSYGSAGGKQVTLTVRDNRGGSVTTPAQTVTVNTLPIANGSVLNGQSSGQPDQKYNHPIVGQSFVLTPQALQAIPGPNGQGAQPGSSDAEDGTNLKSYSWDLNNDNVYETPGQTGSGSGRGSVVVTTPALLTAGAKTVGLRVTDSRDATATNKVNFRVNSIPVAGFTNDPITPVIGDTIRLFSTSTDPDGTSDPLTYAWDLDNDGAFDDSTSPTPTVPAGSTAGTKTIKLRVTDSGGLRNDSTRTIEVQQSIPKGSFQWSPASPLPGQAVTFTNSSSPSAANRQITNVEWDFDWNGTTFTTDAVGATANHAIDSPGTKSVAMKVTEAGSTGGGFAIVFDRIVVNAPPQAAFTVAPGSPFTGDVVTYSSTSVDTDGPLVLHEWDLDGDGAFDDATGPVVSASYKKSGGYNVGLRVTDSRGATATAARMVNVQARPLALLSGVLVEIRGQLEGRLTRITRLLVRAPRGTKVTVRCQGGSCSKAKVVKRKGKGRKKLRIKKFERLLKPRTTIIVTITKPGFLGKRTTIKMRAGKSPLRTDLCLVPGAKRATECPEP
ncbi:MAG: PKD domain-containing protein, partial [Thermomicrobiales bacterium]